MINKEGGSHSGIPNSWGCVKGTRNRDRNVTGRREAKEGDDFSAGENGEILSLTRSLSLSCS